MTPEHPDLTLDEVRERIRVARVPIPDARVALIHGLLKSALQPIRAFDTTGAFLGRVASHGQLNSPWGIAMAPADFGRFSGDLLIGNFGDGEITAFAQDADGEWGPRGQLRGADNRPLAIDGLWALQFGHGAPNNGPTTTLFFTAGPNDEEDGLFGSITAG